MATARNSSEFWSIINRFCRSSRTFCNIYIEVWQKYLQEAFPPQSIDNNFNPGIVVTHPLLHGDISSEEIINSLKKCKHGKAPGCDGVPYTFFKRLHENWVVFLKDLFCRILREKMVP